jgi:nucleoside-diphosphate-sugar epimerase
MNQRWIITGANGYLGGELSKSLHRMGKEVCALARAGRSLTSLESMGISCHTYEEFPVIISKGDVVIHCAGKTGTVGTWNEFASVNIDWSLSLFEQAVQNGASCFIYVSSVAAFGYRNRPGDEALNELSKPELVPGELYGRSKLLAEQALQKRACNSETRLIILRPGLIYGRRFFASSQAWLRRGISIDLHQRIPLVHIDNFLDAVIKVVEKSEVQGVYCLVDPDQPTLRRLNALKLQYGILKYQPWFIGKVGFRLLSLARVLVRILRGRSRMVPSGYSFAQYCFQTRQLTYSTQKLQTEAGWTPTVNLDSGLKDCLTATVSPTSGN